MLCRAAESLVLCRLAYDKRHVSEDEDCATLRREIYLLVPHQRADPSPGWTGDTPTEDEADDNCINLH